MLLPPLADTADGSVSIPDKYIGVLLSADDTALQVLSPCAGYDRQYEQFCRMSGKRLREDQGTGEQAGPKCEEVLP